MVFRNFLSKTLGVVSVVVMLGTAFISMGWAMDTEKPENTEHRVSNPPHITIRNSKQLDEIIKEHGATDLTQSTLQHSFLIPEGSSHEEGNLLRKLFYAFPDINELVLWDPPTEALYVLHNVPHFLQALHLATFKVPMEPEGIKILAHHMHFLRYLRLNIMKGFDNESIEMIAMALCNSSSLTTLLLEDIESCGPEGAQYIAESLKHNKTLTHLKLYRCNIGSQGAAAIFQALGNNSSLKILALKDNIGGDRDTPLNMDGLKRNSTLTHLDLCLSRLGHEEIIVLKNALENNSSLTFLDLGYNHLNHACAQPLRDLLIHNTGLTKLDLSSNSFSKWDTEIFSQTFTINSTLTKLNWTYNDGGGIEILSKNSTLKKLNLCRNRIGHHDVPALCAALRQNTSLTGLNLRGNDINEADKKEIEAAKHPNLMVKWYW